MCEIITSTKNQYVKEAKSLANKKFRRQTGLFLVEGVNLIKDMPPPFEVEYVFATLDRQPEVESIFGVSKQNEVFVATNGKRASEFLKDSINTTVKYDYSSDISLKNSDNNINKINISNSYSLAHTRARVYYVSNDIMAYLADTVSPYGIAAVCKIPSYDFNMPNGNALLLDGITDPGNLGTILRSAAACDFCNIYLLDCVDLYSPKVVRATLGGLFKVNVCEVDIKQAIFLLRNTNSAVLDMGGKNILEDKVSSPVTFVAGNEAHGVREALKKYAKTVYALPMANNIESLNVAVATAVAMYQTV